jgi:hypothetical protein
MLRSWPVLLLLLWTCAPATAQPTSNPARSLQEIVAGVQGNYGTIESLAVSFSANIANPTPMQALARDHEHVVVDGERQAFSSVAFSSEAPAGDDEPPWFMGHLRRADDRRLHCLPIAVRPPQGHPAAKRFRKQEKSRTFRTGGVVEASQLA